MVNVGVVLPAWFSDAGDYLADARALEEAGVHSLWLEVKDRTPDPDMLLAAIAAVTSRVKVGLRMPSGEDARLAVRLETLQRLSRFPASTRQVRRRAAERSGRLQAVVRFLVLPGPAHPAARADT